MKALLFGTAGIPLCTQKHNTTEGIREVRRLGLGVMELEFVRQVNIREDATSEVREAAQKNDVTLTCHGQYFINLNSNEKEKVEASAARILRAARIAWLCGGVSLTFHAAYYMGQESERVYEKVKGELKTIVKALQSEGNNILVRPETTGKPTQFGTVDELLRLSQEVEQVMPCIDFSHIHARSGGKENSYQEFSSTLAKIEKRLGREALDNMHIHVSGISYTEKGERKHLNLKESDMKYEELMKAFKDFKIKGVVISESPNIEEDALLMQKTYEKL